MKKILLVYKKSMYQIYFFDPKHRARQALTHQDVTNLRESHMALEHTLECVRTDLRSRGLAFREMYRARRSDYSHYDLVISVGGDGTFLEASRRITDQIILGVNSDPARSVGHFCRSTAETFSGCLTEILARRANIKQVHRMRLLLDGNELDFQVMNDILVSHRSPAAMSRYVLTVGEVEERQRGSGLWLSTAAGSSGAILSAGGRVLPLGSRRFQYRPRELYRRSGESHSLNGGMIGHGVKIRVQSRMREGMIYVDGAHLRLAFPYGSVLDVCPSLHPLHMVNASYSAGLESATETPGSGAVED